ncbi:hypothetical protein [Bradyrhizobium erythrophlei]|uniref:Uncharacterized protein n=1 Tax=Bradyrhizobium erythrophlei TaxID=1437360 RepID=A0A1M5PV19_9BRAD|nr:hypothetical protein [Bradyrhizobium erythrophlei]SHH05309.1 hypothetical protein SAMN05443248_3511 [Bradyrhizobium erythrophlei]
MPFYYAYHVDKDGHATSCFNIAADDDDQAVEKARLRLKDGQDIEVWCIDRKITDIKHSD